VILHGITQEEMLVNDLIKEGKRCLDEGNLEDAITLLTDANSLDKWRSLYGATILSCLGNLIIIINVLFIA